jgi:exodeoxyribonuclease V alpha subunit
MQDSAPETCPTPGPVSGWAVPSRRSAGSWQQAAVLNHFQVIEQAPLRKCAALVPKRPGGSEQSQVRALMQFLEERGVQPAHPCGCSSNSVPRPCKSCATTRSAWSAKSPAPAFTSSMPLHAMAIPRGRQPARRACMQYLLEEAREEGHMFVPRQALEERCATAFRAGLPCRSGQFGSVGREERIVACPEAPEAPVYLPPLFAAEQGVARRLRPWCRKLPCPSRPGMPAGSWPRWSGAWPLNLSELNRRCCEGVLRHRVVIITGGPGTGKTTLIRAMAAVSRPWASLPAGCAHGTGRPAHGRSDRPPGGHLAQAVGLQPDGRALRA